MSGSCQVSLYLKGEELDPDVVSRILGASPTKSHIKGHVSHTAHGSTIVEKTGLWRLTLRGNIAELPPLIVEIGRIVQASGCVALDLPGVDVAFMDILLIATADDGGGGTIELSLDAGAAQALGRVGLPVEFTFAAVVP
jgi:hypothetical protein